MSLRTSRRFAVFALSWRCRHFGGTGCCRRALFLHPSQRLSLGRHDLEPCSCNSLLLVTYELVAMTWSLAPVFLYYSPHTSDLGPRPGASLPLGNILSDNRLMVGS